MSRKRQQRFGLLLRDSEDFARGVEIGILAELMSQCRRIRDVFMAKNQEQILYICKRFGWEVLELGGVEDGMFYIDMRRRRRRRGASANRGSGQ